jgi:hypothetical protein
MVRCKSGNPVAGWFHRYNPAPFPFPIFPVPPYYPHRTMVYLPTPLSLESLSTDSQRGPSEPARIPPRLNGQSVVQSHHDDPVANQIGLATNQNQNLIQSVQSNSSPRTSVRLSILFSSPERILSTHYFWFAPIIGDVPHRSSNQVCHLTGNCIVCAQNGSSRTTPRGNSRRDLLLCESSNTR